MKQVSKNELAHALNALGKLVCRTSPVEAYRCIRLQAKENNLRLTTTSSTESFSCTMASTGDGDALDCVVLFASLKDAIKGGGSGMVTFSLAEDALTITVDGRGKGTSNMLPLVRIPWPEQEDAPASTAAAVLPEGFVSMLAAAAPMVNRAEPRKVLQGIHLSRNGIAATNGRELLHIPCELASDPFTIPFPLALLATKETGSGTFSIWRKEQGETRFLMQVGRWEWRGQALCGNYPNYQAVIPKAEPERTLHLSPESIELLQAFLKRTAGENFLLKCCKDDAVQVAKLEDAAQCVAVPAQFPQDMVGQSAALGRTILEHLLQGGHTEITLRGPDVPVTAFGGIGMFVAMPLRRTAPVPASAPNPVPASAHINTNHKEEKEMSEVTPAVTAPVPSVATNTEPATAVNPMDELGSAVEEFKQRIKAMFEESSALSRKVKEVALQQKQKERDFILAKRAIERIRMTI